MQRGKYRERPASEALVRTQYQTYKAAQGAKCTAVSNNVFEVALLGHGRMDWRSCRATMTPKGNLVNLGPILTTDETTVPGDHSGVLTTVSGA